MTRPVNHVLIAPLDWGLGHASRCIPLVREFIARGCRVSLAGSGDSLEWLQAEFPGHSCFSLPGYAPEYPARGSMVWSMCRQLPHFMKVIRAEHATVERIVRSEKIDMVISDNRYGCWSAGIHNVFITHQRNVMMPPRYQWLGKIVRMLQDKLVRNFDACWIPDVPGPASLAGELVALEKFPPVIPTRYIGWLSRFDHAGPVDKKLDVVALLSGPEPQRSVFESILVSQLEKTSLSYRVIRGLPAARTGSHGNGNIVDFLSGQPLKQCLQSAALIISRSGYSSIMDLQALGARALFVPTPGQTEQEYLATRLHDKGIAYFMEQDHFDLAIALRESKRFHGFSRSQRQHFLRDALDALPGNPATRESD